MNTEAQKEIEDYTKFISEFDFELSRGKLDVSCFMGNLFQCLAIDRQLQPPHPRDMFQALLELLEEAKPQIKEGTPGLVNEPVPDWRPDMASMYPDGQAITIHLATLIYVFEEWIFAIGQMVPDRAVDRGRAYLAWPRAEWALTNIFLKRFHFQFWSFVRELEMKSERESDFSSFEALRLAVKLDIDFETAAEQLRARNTGFTAAMNRVDHAIEEGFPLEAITICESLVSACLHHFLKAVGKPRPSETLAGLIASFDKAGNKAQNYPADLLKDIDAWRRKRNEALHRFVALEPGEIAKGQRVFLEEAKKTAIDGSVLCAKLLDWLKYESFFFLKTDFELPGPTLN